jgi:hypothetical protein
VVTIGAVTVILTVFGTLAVLVVMPLILLRGWWHDRKVWSGPDLPMHEIIMPMGELQDPQYADQRRAGDSSVDDAHDTAVAVVGLGIKPFANRAPLSVPRSSRSLRHG